MCAFCGFLLVHLYFKVECESQSLVLTGGNFDRGETFTIAVTVRQTPIPNPIVIHVCAVNHVIAS